MVMQVMKYLSFILLLAINLTCRTDASDLPLRKDCIVRVDSLAPEITNFGTNGLNQLMVISEKKGIPLAGYVIASKYTFYIQYGTMCRTRFEMTEMLLSNIFQENQVSIYYGDVRPGRETIDIFGTEWRDGKRKKPDFGH